LGPVVRRDESRIYILRTPEEGEFRGAEQFLRLIQASNFEEWKEAMRLRAHPGSNFVYADAKGNVFYIWNAAIPVRPHAPGAGTPVHITRTEEVWTRLHELESLPQILNPTGGYVRNENDAPWFTNLRAPLNPADYPSYFEGNDLRLRSQHSLFLLDNEDRLSLEEVIRRKHSYRMLLADRLKNDLTAAVRRGLQSGAITNGFDSGDLTEAAALLQRWDHNAAPDSRGAVLFQEWWRLYTASLGGDNADPFAVPWSADDPINTPRGLADPEVAARVFPFAVREVVERFGSWDVAWGDVHRVRHGDVDEPVGGCPGALCCFRVLNFKNDADGRRSVSGGDGWTIAVEFTSPPRAFSVLGYGQSAKTDSPYHDSQATLFARGQMKSVAFTREDVERDALRRYVPGVD
jgi:acyl-homoserine-lactone acylase